MVGPPDLLILKMLALSHTLVWGGLALWLREGYGDVCCSGMEEDSTPSEEWWIYFGLKLAYGESV